MYSELLSCFRYEGTGRSLSLKLLQQLRTQAAPTGAKGEENKDQSAATGRALAEVQHKPQVLFETNPFHPSGLFFTLCIFSLNFSFFLRPNYFLCQNTTSTFP